MLSEEPREQSRLGVETPRCRQPQRTRNREFSRCSLC